MRPRPNSPRTRTPSTASSTPKSPSAAESARGRIEGLRAEINPEEFDTLNIRENLKQIIDLENIRNRGFNTAINSITSILDTSKMGYQYVENLKNARELILREYEDSKNPNSHITPHKLDLFRFVCLNEDVYNEFIEKNTLKNYI